MRTKLPVTFGPNSGDTPVGWTFLSNHAHVLIALARDPDVRLREVALEVGITERAVQKILVDLVTGRRSKRGRSAPR